MGGDRVERSPWGQHLLNDKVVTGEVSPGMNVTTAEAV